MKPSRSLTLWIVNVVSFIFFAILSITGLINFLIFPNGYKGNARGGLHGLNHFLRDIHEIAALLFVIMIVIHILLHRDYIKHNIKKK